MPGLHPEGCCAGAVNRRRVTECGEQEGQIRVIRIAHEPFRLCLCNALEVYIAQNLAHQLPAAAGDDCVRHVTEQHLGHFSSAVFRAGADTDSVSRISIRAADRFESFFPQNLLCMVKCGPIRLDVTAEGRCGKADGISIFDEFRISHVPCSSFDDLDGLLFAVPRLTGCFIISYPPPRRKRSEKRKPAFSGRFLQSF